MPHAREYYKEIIMVIIIERQRDRETEKHRYGDTEIVRDRGRTEKNDT